MTYRVHDYWRSTVLVAFALLLLGHHSSGIGSPSIGFGSRLIVEFENTQLGHFLLVADPSEVQFIDQGGAGPGWRRTSATFREQSALEVNIGLACRFYGSVTPGPNSHFFTIEGPECEGLKELSASLPANAPKWNYEGLAFWVVPFIAGQCPAYDMANVPSIPVYRLYNRGFERGIDSNHRYTTNREIVEAMKLQGWVEEGIAWCTRPNGP